ncbi:dihydroorotase [Actinocorallia aurantiaca]|uniref:Dihydropyrimidinase n=1 Tax=Actinocorallia aurantiaca TaxID=46204 RepID=A0ABN3UAN3_9ACTN
MAKPHFDLVLTGGTVANADGVFRGDVAVSGGRIAGVWPAGSAPAFEAREVRDCTGLWILPGGVDPHVHVGISFGDVRTEEGHAECTRAALAGGTTTIVDFAIPRPGQDPLSAVLERQEAARKGSLADYVLHGCFTDAHAGDTAQIDDMVGLGVRTIKVYTTYRDNMMADDELIAEVMRGLRRHGGLTYVHAEDNTEIEHLMAGLAAQGPIPYEKIIEARPESAENTAVAHVIDLARQNDAPVYFVHQSTETALELTRAARAAGVPAFSEVCPHYTLLDESFYKERTGECFTCCPPLRNRVTVDSVMAKVVAGQVDTIASDHCAFWHGHKASDGQAHDLGRMPFGMPGVQTRLPIVLSELVVHRGLPMSRAVELLSAAPARLSGVYPRKGVVRVGSDADLVLWSGEGESCITADGLLQHSDYTPFEGWRVHGRIDAVIRGGVVVHGEGAVDDIPLGRVVGSGPIAV